MNKCSGSSRLCQTMPLLQQKNNTVRRSDYEKVLVCCPMWHSLRTTRGRIMRVTISKAISVLLIGSFLFVGCAAEIKSASISNGSDEHTQTSSEEPSHQPTKNMFIAGTSAGASYYCRTQNGIHY